MITKLVIQNKIAEEEIDAVGLPPTSLYVIFSLKVT